MRRVLVRRRIVTPENGRYVRQTALLVSDGCCDEQECVVCGELIVCGELECVVVVASWSALFGAFVVCRCGQCTMIAPLPLTRASCTALTPCGTRGHYPLLSHTLCSFAALWPSALSQAAHGLSPLQSPPPAQVEAGLWPAAEAGLPRREP